LDTRALLAGQMKKIVVFADKDHSVRGRVAPDLTVRRPAEIQLEHVAAFGALHAQQSRQRKGQLIVDENLHEALRTG
jgi:hypothetical protein